MGDKVLQQFADMLLATFRESDICGRLGGDEFAVFLPHVEKSHLEETLQRLTQKIADYNDQHQDQSALGISFGVVNFIAKQHNNVFAMMQEADELMYAHKAHCKNSAH